jgi:hypothetical protein
MAKTSELQALVEQFATQLEAIVTRRANEAFAAKFDVVKSQILGGTAAAAPVKVKGRVGRPPGSRAAYAAAAKPCPICGTPNKGRRFSYLCENHRSAENLAKFKGATRKAGAVAAPPPAPVKRGPGRPPKAVKRGPGRPPKAEKTAEPAKA